MRRVGFQSRSSGTVAAASVLNPSSLYQSCETFTLSLTASRLAAGSCLSAAVATRLARAPQPEGCPAETVVCQMLHCYEDGCPGDSGQRDAGTSSAKSASSGLSCLVSCPHSFKQQCRLVDRCAPLRRLLEPRLKSCGFVELEHLS